MAGLRAALYKDGALFFKTGGLAVLVLPLLLLLALRGGLGEVSPYIRPFPVAVRDLDNTPMSRALLAQMEEIQLFSPVYVLEEETDAQALARGAAAVVTIPRDFFYALYTMEDCPVPVTLNESMELEGALFSAIFRSVMDIIGADQAAERGIYQFCYGALTPAQEAELYAGASLRLIRDALGRQLVFSDGGQEADLQGALERRLLAAALAVLVLALACGAEKTLPEERALGVLPRFRAMGCSLAAFAASKFLLALGVSLPALGALGLAFSGELSPPLLLLIALVLLLGAFGLLAVPAAWCCTAAGVQRWGNLLLLTSLVLGGTLWPRTLLPAPLAWAGQLTLPYYGALALEAASRGWSGAEILYLLRPVLWMAGLGLGLAWAGLGRRDGRPEGRPAVSLALGPVPPARPARGTAARLLSLTWMKLPALAGGWTGLALLLAAALLCGAVGASVQAGGGERLVLAVQDQDRSPQSQDLLARLEGREGVVLLAGAGERALLTGEVEGLLTIPSGYGAALEAGEAALLSYEGAPEALSVQGARELIAGQAAVQRSRLGAADRAAERLGRPLSRQEEFNLLALVDGQMDSRPPLYTIQTARGMPLPPPFLPSPLSFAALTMLFTLFSAAPWCGGGRRAEARLALLPRGRLLAYGSDWLALAILGAAAGLAALLPAGLEMDALPALAGCALCIAALALLLARVQVQTGRVDALAPVMALLLCLLGGCFLDVSRQIPALARLAWLTPPGLFLAAAEGSAGALAVLLLSGGLFAALGIRAGRA